jgi:protein-S-isoprenylcysteine O-methyltransferase Ste14
MPSWKDLLFVFIQGLILLAYLLFDDKSLEIGLFFQILGLVLTFSGGCILLISMYQLKKHLSPFPSPKSNSKLIKSGMFRFVRHPIYSAIICMAVGYCIYTQSLMRIFITMILVAFFYYKTRFEEKMLVNQFPEYQEYQKKIGRFIPRI